MVLDLPLRGDTTLSATLSRHAGSAGRAGPRIRVGYRKRAFLRGVLRSGGAMLPDTRIAIQTRRLAGGEWDTLTELVTDGNGRYGVRLPRGASREIRVHFPGNRSLRPATDVVTLLVRGWAKLRLQPRTLRRGGTITFRGHVGLFKARVPASRQADPDPVPRRAQVAACRQAGSHEAERALPDPLPLPPHQPPDADLLPDPRARRGRLALYDGRVEGPDRLRQAVAS